MALGRGVTETRFAERLAALLTAEDRRALVGRAIRRRIPGLRPADASPPPRPRRVLPGVVGPWPPELSVDHYRAAHPDLGHLDDDDLIDHWFRHGITEGRSGSPAATRAGFEQLVADSPKILEIGPLDAPVVRGDHVEYFDVVPTAELREKAAGLGRDPDSCPHIHHVSPVGDLSVVSGTFDRVVSSHAIEHQPDLVGHLQDVGRLLQPGGTYFLVIPDHRYCFDHFLPPSSIADVLGAHARRARLHDPKSVVNTIAMRAHNDPVRHWAHDAGVPAWTENTALLTEAYELCVANPDTYLDTHAWQFTPTSFRTIVATLHDLGLSPLRPARVYETVRNSLEFYAILEHPS